MFLLYYKQYCPYSKNAEKLLSLYNLKYEKIIIDGHNNIREDLSKNPYNHYTLPAIFYLQNDEKMDHNLQLPSDGIFIGGYSGLNNLMSKILSLSKENIKLIYSELSDKFTYYEYLLIAIYVQKIIKNIV